jgi:hypothetical protein
MHVIEFLLPAGRGAVARPPVSRQIMVATHLDREGDGFDNHVRLRADEGVVALLCD